MKMIPKYLGLLVILPLFTVMLTVSYIGEADAAKAEGSPGQVSPKSYGSATKSMVCGDKLCPKKDNKTNSIYFDIDQK
jgi:hypothetical protein